MTEVLTKQFWGSLKGIILLSPVLRAKCGVNKMGFPFSRRDAASRTLIHMKQRPQHTADCDTALVMLTPHPAKPPLSQRPRKYLISHHFRSKRCLPSQSRRSRQKFDLELRRDSILDAIDHKVGANAKNIIMFKITDETMVDVKQIFYTSFVFVIS